MPGQQPMLTTSCTVSGNCLEGMALRQPANHRALTLPAKAAADRRDKPGERFQQRRFSAAVGTDNGGHAAAFNDAEGAA
jgi:hypothetical protein